MESCSEEDEPEEDAKVIKKEKERAGLEHARAVADHYEDEEDVHEKLAGAIGGGIVGGLAGGPVGALLGAGAGDQLTDDEEDKTGDMSDEDLLNKVKKMGTAGDALIKAAEERLKDGMSLTAHERDALGRDAYGDAEKEIAKESVSYTTKYII